jgi:hypothetical protein
VAVGYFSEIPRISEYGKPARLNISVAKASTVGSPRSAVVYVFCPLAAVEVFFPPKIPYVTPSCPVN